MSLKSLIAMCGSLAALSPLALALGASPPAFAHRAIAEDLPSAEEILDRYVEVTGGAQNYDKIETRITRSSVEIPSQGIRLELTIYAAKPNRFRSVVESDVYGKIEKGVSGDVVWENSLMTGPSIKEGEEKAAMLQDATFDRLAYWRKVYGKAECTGAEQVGERECYTVVLTPAAGDPLTLSFDRETGLLLKIKSVQATQGGKIPVETFISDYRDIGGMTLAHRARVIMMGQERIIETLSLENNAELPEGIFELPEEVRKIAERS